YKNVPVDSGTVTISRSPSTSTAAVLICIRLRLPMGKSDEPELFSRLREHSRSIGIAQGLELQDFMCRFVIFEDTSSDMIGTIEAALIKLNMPLWNTAVDGFGNHDPGSGRYEQAKSDWDVIHPGRAWAEKCNGAHAEKSAILASIKNHLKNIERKP
ncbi:MAG: Eco29kI family restriction endonuclease, partial [Gallionellaceae bacterium]